MTAIVLGLGGFSLIFDIAAVGVVLLVGMSVIAW